MDRDVKWSSHTQVVNMITEAMTYLRLIVVSPIKPWTKYKNIYSESISSKPDQSSVTSSTSSASGSSTNIIRVFTPSSSRTSFSSMSSTSSKDSDNNLDNQKQRKKTWAVLQIKNYK